MISIFIYCTAGVLTALAIAASVNYDNETWTFTRISLISGNVLNVIIWLSLFVSMLSDKQVSPFARIVLASISALVSLVVIIFYLAYQLHGNNRRF